MHGLATEIWQQGVTSVLWYRDDLTGPGHVWIFPSRQQRWQVPCLQPLCKSPSCRGAVRRVPDVLLRCCQNDAVYSSPFHTSSLTCACNCCTVIMQAETTAHLERLRCTLQAAQAL